MSNQNVSSINRLTILWTVASGLIVLVLARMGVVSWIFDSMNEISLLGLGLTFVGVTIVLGLTRLATRESIEEFVKSDEYSQRINRYEDYLDRDIEGAGFIARLETLYHRTVFFLTFSAFGSILVASLKFVYDGEQKGPAIFVFAIMMCAAIDAMIGFWQYANAVRGAEVRRISAIDTVRRENKKTGKSKKS